MKLPIIKQIVQSNEFDEDYLGEAIDVLICIAEARGIKDEEMEVISELISNISGAQEVMLEMKKGTSQKDALNGFMKRVIGAIN
jgi:hypothetical protein